MAAVSQMGLTDFEEVTASIRTWDTWCAAWSARAAVHEETGRAALVHGKRLSAGEHLQRAGVYYHFAKFLFVHDVAQMKAAHMKAVRHRHLRSRMPASGAAASGAGRRARRHSVRRPHACGNPAQPDGNRAAAGAGDGVRTRFLQG